MSEPESEHEQVAEFVDDENDNSEFQSEIEPPLVTGEEQILTELPEDLEYICLSCKEHNLIAGIDISSCQLCENIYCVHYASSVDPGKCSHCIKEVIMVDETVTKTREVYSEKTDKVYRETQKARRIAFSGLGWLFATRKISTISNVELALAIEYHHTIFNEMISERERRRMEYFHRNQGKGSPIRVSTGGVNSTETITTRKSTVTKTAKVSKKEVDLKSILEQLLNSGMSVEQITKMGTK